MDWTGKVSLFHNLYLLMQKDEVVFNDSSLSYITRKNLLTARGSAAAAHSLMSASTGFDENDYETRSFLKKVKTQPCTKQIFDDSLY